MGMGYWTRANTEPCLLATRGKPKRLDAGVRQGIIAPRQEHSRKPDEIHDRIERLVAGPYLELFARRPRAGWTVWGNEVPSEYQQMWKPAYAGPVAAE
jgi:N6-adenosine-specific RNA methylase IME4